VGSIAAVLTRFHPVALAAAFALGCAGGEAHPDASETQPCPIGDPAAPAELEIVHLDAQNTVIESTAMATVPLIQPPQGGWIVLLGARARNIDGCRIRLTTALVDPCNDEILKIDQRPTRLIAGSDGWGVSSVSAFSNLEVCPHITSVRDLNDVPYILRVRIEDDEGREAQTEVTLVPTCPAGNPMCDCQCARDYVVGSQCNPMPPQDSCDPGATARPR
jgi:hypothetical protein